MNRTIAFTTLVALSIAGISPAAAGDDNYIVGSGISRAEAQNLTFEEVQVALFNRGASGDDRQTVVDSAATVNVDPARNAQLIAAAGLSADMAAGMTLGQLSAAKFNADSRGQDQQTVQPSVGSGRPGSQLIASAGLTAAEAQGMSIEEVTAAKFARDKVSDN